MFARYEPTTALSFIIVEKVATNFSLLLDRGSSRVHEELENSKLHGMQGTRGEITYTTIVANNKIKAPVIASLSI